MNAPSSRLLFALLALILLGAQAKAQYRPGQLAKRADLESFLTPPSQEGVPAHHWRVEAGIDLFHFEEGLGRDVLFVHGGPGFAPTGGLEGWRRLQKGFRVHYYHQRGCGKSTRPFDKFEGGNRFESQNRLTATLGLEQHIADIDRIRRLLGQEKLILAGTSFGAFLCTMYAVEFPERVEKLVLISPAEVLTMPPAEGGLYETIRARLPEGEIRQEYQVYLSRFFGVFGNPFVHDEARLTKLNRELGRFYAAALKEQGLDATRATIPEGHAAGWMPFAIFFSMGMSYDHRAALAAIRCPVLMVHGTQDFLVTESGKRSYQDSLESVQAVTIEGAGHQPSLDQPEAFGQVLRRFLEAP